MRSPVFSQYGKVPPFKMLQSNGNIFKAQDLPMGKPIVLVYFLTDCDHCHQLTKEMIRQREGFSKASVAMVTYQPRTQVSKFITDFKLSGLSNFYVGTEGSSLFVRNYYNIQHMPFLVLFTAAGTLVKTYSNIEPSNSRAVVNDVAHILQTLKS